MTNQENSSNHSDAIDFYWRPGCGFCAALLKRLDKANYPLNKINIWENPEGAAFVRSVADGNETVPTISVSGRSMVNPSAEEVAALLTEVAPHLLDS